MYDKASPPDLLKYLNLDLHIPCNLCQLLSADRAVCLVNDEWMRLLHAGRIPPAVDTGGLDGCQIERFLSRSCEKISAPWVKVTVKVIAKSDKLYHGLQGQYLHKQWSCESLFEFMSHITKENMTNLWKQAQNRYQGTSQQSAAPRHVDCLKFTDLVREVLCRLQPLIYISLQSDTSLQSSHKTPAAAETKTCPEATCHDVNDYTTDGSSSKSSSRPGSFYTTSDAEVCQGVVSLDAVIETDSNFYVVQPYYPFTLQDAVTFSPTVLESSHAKPLFLIFQLLHAIQAFHNKGLRVGDIRICDVLLSKNFWLRISSPRLGPLKSYLVSESHDNSGSVQDGTTSCNNARVKRTLSSEKDNLVSLLKQQPGLGPSAIERNYELACQFMATQDFNHFKISQLDSLVNAWVHRNLTNFQYLMILNHLAGRRMGDPNNHPVLPWVLDFSSPDSGYRDLTKSKFRLNKGDGQLDFMYSGMYGPADVGDHVPHHVSDILSDITYYVYKARRTPKYILCAHVRSNWVPHEYPVSMQRLQDWTPDECIPEFFTDPSIFNSIHEDLADLEIPPWSTNTVDFVILHLAALESEYVSLNLHHWIDLTFGYKLSGPAAVKAKNVHLRLVDHHTHLTSHGAAQLFQQPHPQRKPQQISSSALLPKITRGLLNTQLLTYGLPESEKDTQYADASFDSSELGRINQASIHLPRNYNPLADLQNCETLLEFRARALHSIETNSAPEEPPPPARYQEDGITEDMVTFLCLTCEMFLDARLRMQGSRLPLWKRADMIQRLCLPAMSAIQRPLQKFVHDMFQSLEVTADKNMFFQAIFPDGSPPPTPSFLLQPYCDLIPFPSYFAELHTCLCQVEEKSREVELLMRKQKPSLERANRIKALERDKVPLIGTFLWKYQSYLGSEGMELVLPYIQDLLQNEYTTVQSAWSLFDITTRELGPTESTKQFLPLLTALFSVEMSSAKHIKLYHRSFLVQLIIQLGMETFLTYFSTLLVEAVAGYKDFLVNSRFYSEDLLEDMEQDQILKSSCQQSKSASWLEETLIGGQDYKDSGSKIAEEPSMAEDVATEKSNTNHFDAAEEADLVDQMSLDGAHVLLGDDGLDSDRKVSLGETSDRDSLNSASSDDRVVEIRARPGRAKGSEDQSLSATGPYENADQHSIHSISHIMSQNLQNSPTVLLGDQEPFEEFPNEKELLLEGSSVSPRLEEGSQELINLEEFNRRFNASQDNSKSVIGSSSALEIDNSYFNNLSAFVKVKADTLEMTHEDEDSSSTSLKYLDELPSNKNNITQDHHILDSDQISKTSTEGMRQNNSSTSLTQDDVDSKHPSLHSRQTSRVASDMIRSETEDMMASLSSDKSGHITNIRDIAADSVKWLSHKLGPVLATKFLCRNLVRMLALCYLGPEQLQLVEQTAPGQNVVKTSRLVAGDLNAHKVLECIGFNVVLYGEQVVLIHCLRSIVDMIIMAKKRLSPRSECGLIAAVVLLTFLIPYLSDTNLMDLLEESILFRCINPVIAIITSPCVSFPSGAVARFVLCHKLVDLLYTLGLRLGLEMTRKYLTSCMQQLFDTFSIVHGGAGPSLDSLPAEPSLEHGSTGSEESYLTIKMDPLTHQYAIGSPVDLRSLKSSPRRNLSGFHSLTAVGIIDDKDDYVDPRSPSTSVEKCAQEMKCVFSPELAQACYIPLCRIFGSIHMEEQLHNEDLIRRLCSQHDLESDLSASASQEGQSSQIHSSPLATDDLLTPTEERPDIGGIGSNVAVTGNRIQLLKTAAPTPIPPQVGQFGRGYRHSGILSIHVEDLRSADMEQNKTRHLRGHWLAYWEREIGLHERDTMFNFMQIELQTFLGHTSSIRSLYTMDTENCFISACKDKTVRLWSINSSGDGMNKQQAQFCYTRHKKSVFSVVYVDSMRQVASCDSTVHIWDPYTGVAISQLESAKYAPVVALAALPAPSTLVAMATTEATLRFLDMRTSKYAHEFRCSLGSAGLIRCLAVSPDSHWVALGFSTGLICVLDINTGMFLHYWKAHDAEILQLKAYSKSRLLSSAFDQTVKLWNVDNGQEVCPTKNHPESVHCLSVYRDQLLTATTANRISVYASVTDSMAFLSSKLKPSSFKGVLTCMSVLPLNKALLLGADSGVIRLMA